MLPAVELPRPPAKPSVVRSLQVAELDKTALSLRDFLSLLPWVRAVDAAREFDMLVQRARIAGEEFVRLGHVVMHLADVDSYFFNYARHRRVSQRGARWFIYLYQQGVLPYMTRRPSEDLDAAHRYVRECRDAPSQVVDTRLSLRQYRQRLADLDSFREDEFVYKLLDDIFWRHLGGNLGHLGIGCQLVTRERPAVHEGGLAYGFRYTWLSNGERRYVDVEQTTPASLAELERWDEQLAA